MYSDSHIIINELLVAITFLPQTKLFTQIFDWLSLQWLLCSLPITFIILFLHLLSIQLLIILVYALFPSECLSKIILNNLIWIVKLGSLPPVDLLMPPFNIFLSSFLLIFYWYLIARAVFPHLFLGHDHTWLVIFLTISCLVFLDFSLIYIQFLQSSLILI